MKFTAFDGKVFDTIKECKDYEDAKSKEGGKINLNNKTAEAEKVKLENEKMRLERLEAIKNQVIKLDTLVSLYVELYPEHVGEMIDIMNLSWPYDDDEDEDIEDEDDDDDECCCGCCEDIDDCIVESAIELVCAFDKLKALVDYCCE